MNTLGICSWTLGLDKAPDKLMAKVRSLGLDSLQYSGDIDRIDPVALSGAAAAEGLQLFAIDPFDCAPPEGVQPDTASAVAFFQRVIDFAQSSGARAVTLHGLARWTANCRERQEAWQRIADCCAALLPYARSRGIEPLYEICNRYEVSQLHTAAEWQALFGPLQMPPPRLILDSFHMNIEETDPCATLHEHAANLSIYHVSDSNRGGIGAGHVDFDAQHAVLRERSFQGPVMFECVLQHLSPSTPPASADDWRELDRQLVSSIRWWKKLAERREAMPV